MARAAAVCFCLAVAACGVLATATSTPSCDTTATEQSTMLTAALKSLESSNYPVASSGSLVFQSSSGFGLQDSDKVGVWSLPGSTTAGFPLGPQQVGVWLGCTPPTASYYSFSQVVMTKQPGFHVVWAQPADSVNMLVANTTAQGGSAFNSTAAVVVSADATAAGTVVAALQAAGVSAINVIPVPSSLVGRMATTPQGDLMQVVHRAIGFADADAGSAYTASTWPVTIVSPPGNVTPNPFPVPAQRSRTGPTSEESLDDEVADLMGNVTQRMSLLGFRAGQSIPLSVTGDSDGRTCLANNTFCGGASSDGLYARSAPVLSFTDTAPTQNLFVVVGVNGASYGTSTVAALAFRALGVSTFATVPSSAYNNSAFFFDSNLPRSDALYAYVVARNCSRLTPVCMEVSADAVASDVMFTVEARNILNPATRTGPSAAQSVMPMVLRFFAPNSP